MLDGLNVTKDTSTNEWKCRVGTVNLFGLEFHPIVYMIAQVSPEDQTVTFNITRSEIEVGSDFASFNQTFAITGSHVISSGFDKVGYPTIQSKLSLQVDTLFPVVKMPKNLLQNCGVHVVKCALNTFAPHIINTLALDYIRWTGEKLELKKKT